MEQSIPIANGEKNEQFPCVNHTAVPGTVFGPVLMLN